jgi:hypothetical protein
MGIERFFKSINSLYANQIIKPIYINRNITHFYFDFNSVIHKVSANVTNHLNDMLMFSLIYKYSNESYMDKELCTDEYNKINKIYNIDFDINNFYKNTKSINLNHIIFDFIFKDIKDYLAFYPNCKFLYIGIDGIPSVGKMIEQQDRRYKGYLQGLINKKLIEKHKNSLDNNHFDFTNIYNEYEYLQLRFSFDKNLISPQTDFMIDFINLLKKQKFESIKELVISGFDEVGEGEKKIVKYIKKFNKKDDFIIIYSPDADMIVMSMILPNNIHILRHEQSASRDDIIDIQSIRKIFNPVEDIAYIFSVFGDDFIPKIEWVNVTKHLQKILNEYKKMGVRIIENGLVNFKNLREFFKQIKKFEFDYKPSKNPFDDHIITINYKSFKYENELNNIEKLVREYKPSYDTDNGNIVPVLDYYNAMLCKYNYYFLDDETNNDFYYSYDHAPTIDQLIEFSDFNLINIDKYKTTTLLPIDQLSFISPIDVSKYVEKQKINKEIASKLFKLMKINIPEIKIINDKINIDEIFDCKNARYLNKCHLKFNIILFEKFKLLLT